METIIYVNCFKPKPNILNALPYLGILYLFVCILAYGVIPYNIYLLILLNGLLNTFLPCYYLLQYENYANNRVIINNNQLVTRRRRINNNLINHVNIWKISVVYIEEDFFCTICYEDHDRKAIFNNCDHYMCYNCIMKIYKNECPFCREAIVNT